MRKYVRGAIRAYYIPVCLARRTLSGARVPGGMWANSTAVHNIYLCVCMCVYDYFYYYTSMKIIYSSRLSLFFFLNDKKITFIRDIIRYAGYTIWVRLGGINGVFYFLQRRFMYTQVRRRIEGRSGGGGGRCNGVFYRDFCFVFSQTNDNDDDDYYYYCYYCHNPDSYMSRYTLYVKGARKRGGRFRPRCGDKLHVRRHDLARLLNDDKTRSGQLLLFSVSKNSWPKKKNVSLVTGKRAHWPVVMQFSSWTRFPGLPGHTSVIEHSIARAVPHSARVFTKRRRKRNGRQANT